MGRRESLAESVMEPNQTAESSLKSGFSMEQWPGKALSVLEVVPQHAELPRKESYTLRNSHVAHPATETPEGDAAGRQLSLSLQHFLPIPVQHRRCKGASLASSWVEMRHI